MKINLSYNLKNKRKQEEYYIQNELEERYVNNFKIIEINMELYKEMWYSNNIKEIEENKYLVMLDLEKEELEKLSEKDKVVSQYMEELDRVNEDLEFRQFMSHEEDERKIFNSRMRAAEEKGLEDGIKQGMKEGIEKGKLDLVKEALKLEIDIDIISKMSKMPIEEIKNIKNNLN